MNGRCPAIRFRRWCYLASVAAFAVWGYLRIHTYATGQDPRTFLLLAKGIVTGRAMADSSFVVPGWPLVLAGVIKAFGIHAAYWTNVPLFVLLVAALQALLEALTGSWRRGAAMAAGAVLLVLGGYVLNPHYLLWVFRQTPMYLTGVLGWLCLVRAAGRQAEGRPGASCAWLGGALAAAAAGILVRETGALALPGMGLYLLAVATGWAGPADGDRKRRWFLFAVFSGIGVAALVAGLLAVRLLHLSVVTGQAGYIIRTAPAFLSAPLREWPMWPMLARIPAEFGWAGCAALLIGIAAAFRRRNRDFLFVFLWPALAHLVFEGLIKFHWRFFLSTVFYLAPLAMLGALAAGEWVWNRFSRWMDLRGRPGTWWRGAGRWRPVLLRVVLLVWAVKTVSAFAPWDLAVSRADADRAVELLAPWTGPDRPLLVDGRTTYLAEVLEMFTDWRLKTVDPESAPSCVADPPLAFVQAANDRAVYGHRRHEHPPGEQMLEGYADLEPVPDGGEFSLDTSRYRIWLVHPWTKRSVVQSLPPPPESGMRPSPSIHLLQVSLPVGAPNDGIRVYLEDRLWADGLRPGRQFLAVPDGMVPPGDAAAGGPVIRFESDEPIPSRIPVRWIDPDEVLEMPFGTDFPPSCNSYLSAGGAAVSILLPEGLAGGGEERDGGVSCAFSAGIGAADRWAAGGRLVATMTLPEFPEKELPPVVRPAQERPQAFRFDFGWLPRMPSIVHLHVEHEADGEPERREAAHFHVASLSIGVRRTVERVEVQVGRPEDGLLLGTGFFHREDPHGPGHGRWTGGECGIFLPLKLGRDYQFSMEYGQLRPDGVPPAVPRLELNGHPLEAETTDTGVEARLPAEWLERTNQLVIRTGTWSPADHGARDNRQLGIFLRAFRAEPL